MKTKNAMQLKAKINAKKMPYTKDITFEETVGKLEALLSRIRLLN